MRNYIATNDNEPRRIAQVDMINCLLRKWEDYIMESRHSMNHQCIHGKKLTLYIDQETYYDLQELMSFGDSIGPLTIGMTMAPREHDTTLFGHDLTIMVVMNHGRHDHLIFL